jgi:hypothetical protein
VNCKHNLNFAAAYIQVNPGLAMDGYPPKIESCTPNPVDFLFLDRSNCAGLSEGSMDD